MLNFQKIQSYLFIMVKYILAKKGGITMDYKLLYEQALERAKKLKETCDSTAVIGWCEYIFPQLKVSEDEKIRKALISGVKQDMSSFQTIYGIDLKKVLSWLEKRGEKKYTEEELQKAYKTADEVQYRRGYEDAKRELEMQGEKKSDICDGCNNVKGCITCTNGDQWAHYSEVDDSKQELTHSVTKKSEQWSEEDEKMCRMCNDAVEYYHTSEDENVIREWLQSLKERVVTQQQWKPTELQLDCIEDAIQCYHSFGHPATKLKELLEQLKKLKGE